MIKGFIRFAITAISVLTMTLPGFAGQLDDHYLAAFGERHGSAIEKAILSPVMDTAEAARCGTPLKHGLKRDWNKLEPATQKVLAKQLAAPVLSGTETTLISNSGKFKIHYTTSGGDAVPSLAWVQTVAQTFEDVANSYAARGWNLAPTVNAAPYDVYLRELASQSLYGQTISSQAVPSAGFPYAYASFIEIDNNFSDGIYVNSTGGPYSATQSLQITASHEYHHAIQYGYNYYFDIWYAEATSTWYEDELYDDVNQLYNYIRNWFSNSKLSLDTTASTTTGGGYGRWIFNRYLAEQHSTGVVKASWDKLASLGPSTNQTNLDGDIRMVPVLENLLLAAPFNSSLGAEFLSFAKRVYKRDWSSHTAEIIKIPNHSPVASYSSYPVNPTSTATPSVILPHYSFAYYKFTPSTGAPANLNITITGTSGIKATAFKTSGGSITEFPFNSVNGTTVTIPGFSSSSEAVLLVANTTAIDSHQANFSTDGSVQNVQEPSGGAVNGSCGSADNTTFSVAPILNLCDSGTATTVLGTGPWNWSCSGSNGGSTATCSAQVLTVIQNASITSGNGAITSLNELTLNDPILSPATKPLNFIATGAISLAATVTSGSTVTIQLSNLTSLPMNPVFYKIVGTQWIKLQPADYTFTGSTLTFKVTDNGPYDLSLIHI